MLVQILMLNVIYRFEATVAKNGDVWPTYQKAKLETFYGGANGQPISGGTLTEVTM